ncbi:hypothetical protein DQ04_00131250 [Trypanosoma grayi]|uniref:hypothetical protein n=1 Tax=Trypanosoma grayi TaxID=71804 RepID=UPI0004F458A3|nr:hypothetical protein DQ04_00131250 [Trypanosoma grayi]KEG15266.1 hypothetical protein DQ04_00131250 [Trypanosoma grayi]
MDHRHFILSLFSFTLFWFIWFLFYLLRRRTIRNKKKIPTGKGEENRNAPAGDAALVSAGVAGGGGRDNAAVWDQELIQTATVLSSQLHVQEQRLLIDPGGLSTLQWKKSFSKEIVLT